MVLQKRMKTQSLCIKEKSCLIRNDSANSKRERKPAGGWLSLGKGDTSLQGTQRVA